MRLSQPLRLAVPAALLLLACSDDGPSKRPSSDAGEPPAKAPDGGLGDGDDDAGDEASRSDAGVVESPANLCPARTGKVVEHKDNITADETWAGDGTVHKVTWTFAIRGATLTLAPCAIVQLVPNHGLGLEAADGKGAKLVARGTAQKPIRFERADAALPWGTLQNFDTSSLLDLAFVTLSGGGSAESRGAVLELRGAADVSKADPMLRVDHVLIEDADSRAIALQSSAAFTADSSDLTIQTSGKGAADYPVSLTPIALGTLPSGKYTGNASDAVLVTDVVLRVTRDLTVRNRGIAYYWKFDTVRVLDPGGGAEPTLTIEPGVEMRLDDYIQVGEVGHAAKLLALGSPEEPIVFTSSKADPVAGSWAGIWLVLADGSKLHNVVIDYAGGDNRAKSANCRPTDSSDDAALVIGAQGSDYKPSAADFENVTISNCAGHGINALWTSDKEFGPDITASFTFDGIAGCRQTKNATLIGCQSSEGCLAE